MSFIHHSSTRIQGHSRVQVLVVEIATEITASAAVDQKCLDSRACMRFLDRRVAVTTHQGSFSLLVP